MALILTLQIQADESAVTADAKYIKDASDDREGFLRLAELMQAFAGGTKQGKVTVKTENGNGTASTQTVTCAGGSAASGDTLVVGGVTFTVVTTASTVTQVALSTASVTLATNLAAKLNAYSAFLGNLTATTSTSICTITRWAAGREGNFITLTETGSGFTLGGSTLAGATGARSSGPRTYNAGK